MRRSGRREAGFTLVEAMVGAAVGSMVLAGLALATVSSMRSSKAVQDFTESVLSQSRILDYLSRDVRRASSVSVTGNPTQLTVTVADQYAAAEPSRTFKVPTVSLTSASYGAGPLTISYFLSGSYFVRRENGVATIIAANVSNFQPTFDTSDPTGRTVKFTLTFLPGFQSNPSSSARQGTTITATATRRAL